MYPNYRGKQGWDFLKYNVLFYLFKDFKILHSSPSSSFLPFSHPHPMHFSEEVSLPLGSQQILIYHVKETVLCESC